MKRLIVFIILLVSAPAYGGVYLLDDIDKIKDGGSLTYDNKTKWTEPNTTTVNIGGLNTVMDKNPQIRATIHHHHLGNGLWRTVIDIDGERSEGTSTNDGDIFTTKLDKINKPQKLIDAINAAKVDK